MLLSGLLGVKKSEGGQQRRTPGGMLVRGVASGIGLASEAYHHHKEKNAAKGGERDTGPSLIDRPAIYGNSNTQPMTLSQQVDEAAWQLDDAQQQIMQEEPQSSATDDSPPPQLAEAFLQAHPSPSDVEVRTEPLALPVVITQRRPGKRTRGFIRAYAPILNDVGISEATFLEFMDDLNKAVMPSPWIQALNLAALAGLAAPQPFTVLISLAVQQATNAASAAHSRYKTNNFLDQVNRSFFMPRGLIALIMTWKPSEPGQMMTDMNFDMEPMITSVAKEDEQSSLRKMKNKFAQSNGATAFEWPETAPLVFPVLDTLSAADAQKKQNVLKRAGDFVGEYMDSRSRAQWAGQNPDSKMANAGPKEQFHSRYSDPNHPASSGDPVALLTGGHFQSLLSGGRGILSRGIDREERGVLGGPIRMISGVGGIGVGADAVKKIFEKDILYLMVIQLPTQEQIAEASAFVPQYEMSA
ncbi:hypothetical protein F5Y07DRAFT_381983 [Xylaria sp. FL0933]|nr:hypothetical protein F5Y07DRAFT_381983 [Xylaria sp. FL0933]